MQFFAWLITLGLWTCAAAAQPSEPPALDPDSGAKVPTAPSLPQADPASEPPATDAADAGTPDAEPAPPPAAPPPLEERGDTPISAEEIMGEEDAGVSEAPTPAKPEPREPAREQRDASALPVREPEAPPPGPLVVWATSEWGNALGRARCGSQELEGTDSALRVAAALAGSTAVGGLGIATGGALSDHPLLAYAAKERPDQLAELLSSAGFSALALGISDLAGPLFREPRLSEALAKNDVAVVATNLVCGGQTYCEAWYTAEDPLPVLERRGRRYTLLALLPDDALGRVEPLLGERLALEPARETMLRRLEEARSAGTDLIVAEIDHGPDASASGQLASFLAELPTDLRPDLLLSPSSGENLLFLRPLDVQPAIVGTRRDVLTGVRVVHFDERDTDVRARSVRLSTSSETITAQLRALGRDFCAARAAPLAGGRLEQPLRTADFVALAGAAARQLAHADLALVDPRAFEPSLTFAAGETLQRAELARAVPFDAPLMIADVTLDWLNGLRKQLEGPRPLTLIGVEQDGADTLVAGRLAVPGAHYRIVTSAVLVRSQRLPGGAEWRPTGAPSATLRGAIETLFDAPSRSDPRARLHDPRLGTQWLVRLDGQVLANLTAVRASPEYDDPALQADDSRQLGGRLVLNADSDAPHHLFENVVQVAFDRNLATNTTAQDLTFVQTTYTYRGLWPKPQFYPHPFVEGYLETSFLRPEDLLLRPRAGVRSIFTRVFSLKLAAGLQYEVFDDSRPPYPGLGGELLLKPWTIVSKSGTLQLEGNVVYYWDGPGRRDEHMLRAQLIAGYQLIGPLQMTLSALGVLRKLPDPLDLGQGLTMQVGIRVRFVGRAMID
jgi:hypothetical protein